MFREYPCGCIVSIQQGRVRICEQHRPEQATGDGADQTWVRKGQPKLYPANGELVGEWSGK